ncbi:MULTISPECIES: helix-turn-helix domain-containing protein [Planktothrix]|nr:helix-turn-helix domain-containing protein [Planktothrix agardhii KL2]MCB8750342.1 helix-turn-helix domain-containing protein [Planktothrix agardhii 1810]MCB8759109.1 helix-turn-helix domain-containing protein [Planktothrix agardhii 1813]MCB8765146.1 helix-turn-helix domain-containing protein [Planktothrix agardhii 1809]MCB8778784.1 helix-turn-helix domain-containing protein [Planktothrix agardhii 1031]MCB8783203.1 helix-turn-helix domain-containing protein [Planktothrix agardhii 1808]MCB8
MKARYRFRLYPTPKQICF